ncbi:mitochondrial substrate carrier family protein J-like [Sycon ciliatum]|uniref:mitochondrial substrate carrier family protein J-like n=1 Tax=Sycon ciliatum TaxID=27933 RepID=UPI0020A860CE|eukprot:scpid71491/ scgid21689/ Solute carrier family 25 member 44
MAGMDNGQQVIGWDDLDKRKLYVIGPTFSLAVRALLYPPMLIKTRLQVQNCPYKGTFDAFSKVVKLEGFRALYKGFPTNCMGLGVGQVYITTYEISRKHATGFGFSHGWNNFIAGAAASTISQCLIVPIDVVTQLQMIQGQVGTASNSTAASTSAKHVRSTSGSGSTKPTGAGATVEQRRLLHTEPARGPTVPDAPPSSPVNSNKRTSSESARASGAGAGAKSGTAGVQSARQIAMNLYQTEGVRGLYRGYFASLLTYVPSSGIWWGSYGMLYSYSKTSAMLSAVPLPLIHAVCGGMAGCIASVTTNPLDVVRTRLQVEGSRSGWKTVQTLWREEGPRWLARGVVARIMSAVPSGAVIIVSYETVKRLSVRT